MATIIRMVAKQAGMERNKFGFAALLMSEGIEARGVKVPATAATKAAPAAKKEPG